MSAEAFGVQVKQRRLKLRMSRADLARRAGMSESGVKNIESGQRGAAVKRWSDPRRETVIDLAVALDWDPDEALSVSDNDPLQEWERQRLAASTASDNSRHQLDKMWSTLTVRQRRAVLRLVEAMVDPHGRADGPEDVVVYRFAAAHGDQAASDGQS